MVATQFNGVLCYRKDPEANADNINYPQLIPGNFLFFSFLKLYFSICP